MKTATTTIEVKIPVGIGEALDAVVERTRRSRDEVVQEAIEAFLRGQESRSDDPGWPRSIGAIEDAPFTSENYEDWLKENWRPEDDWGRP